MEESEDIIVDLVARTNDALSCSAHCYSIQFENLYFEEVGMSPALWGALRPTHWFSPFPPPLSI